MPIDPLTVISAIVAIIVIWKLRSVLGQRTGLEKPPSQSFRPDPPPPPGSGTVIRLPGAGAHAAAPDPARWRPYADPGTPVAAGLDAIAAGDPSFSAEPFVEGAKIAYEAVITAFAAGERKTLQSLLAKDVYDSFAAALADRERRKEVLTTTFVSMDDARIEAAGMDGQNARVTVRFASKQISATRDSEGKLTDGSPDRVVDMDDIWTFARDVTSRDPNWKLVATQSGQ